MLPTLSSELIDAPPLPKQIFLPDGQELATHVTPWTVRDLSYGAVHFEFGVLFAFDEAAIICLKHTFCHFLETRSVSHSRNVFGRLLEFHTAILGQLGSRVLRKIELPHLLNWRSKLDDDTIWKLGVVRILLEKAASLGVGISSDEALVWLDDAVIPGNPKGVDVRTRDPNRGAFSPAEIEALNAALNAAYREGEIGIADYAAGHVVLAFGVRGRQLAALKERDLIVAPTAGGEKRYILRIPQAKQRGERTRDSFRSRPCDRRLGHLLEQLIEENRLRRSDPSVPDDEWPLFIGPDRGENPPGFAYHQTARELSDRTRVVVEARAQIKANSKRFRHTLAQNMADDGASKYEIAEALGHTDTQQVGKYIEARPEMVARLNHIAEDFVPILQAFAGVLVSSNDAAATSAPTGKRLHERALESGGERPLGHCGQHSFCDLAKPIGCYTCASFRPWVDGPHEEMLGKLKAERQRKVESGLSPKIYTINDRTIAAVTEVVRLCRQHRAAAQTGSS
jgi:integrase